MAGRNLASKYSTKVDERFARESQAMLALNNDYSFEGVDTVKVYSIPTVAMTDYKRTGNARYGTPDDLSRNVQTLTVTRDRAFTFIIDKGDKIQSQMVMDAGKALQRQLAEVWVPEYDSYVFMTLAHAATNNGAIATTPITKENAYEMFLNGMEYLGNHNVPDKGRVAFCSYRFANYLKLDPAFMKSGDRSQEMVEKGVIGEVDGCKIVKVPASRLPAGAAFLITHPLAATAPKQLEEYKIHDNPPGISGWLCEGRVVYDCFVLNEKVDAIYYHGSQAVVKTVAVTFSQSLSQPTKGEVVIPGQVPATNKYRYKLYKTSSAAPAVTYDADLTSWTDVTSGEKITLSGNNAIAVAEVNSADNKARGVGYATLGAV